MPAEDGESQRRGGGGGGRLKRNCHAVTRPFFMALITLAGFPAAGKSTRTKQLADFLTDRIAGSDYQGPIDKVAIISDDSLGLTRACYDGIVLRMLRTHPLISQRVSSKSPHGAHFSQQYSVSWPPIRCSLSIRSTTSRASATRCTAPRASSSCAYALYAILSPSPLLLFLPCTLEEEANEH